MATPVVCPKCTYRRQPADSHVMEGVCPKCGIAYAKYRARQEAPREDLASVRRRQREEESHPWRERLAEQFLFIPDTIEAPGFYGRCALLALFFLWGWSFILGGLSWISIGGSFLHNVNLPFHEFGHVLFSPFGRFMAILGGSLFQVILPLILMLAFSIQQRDNFAAAIMLWWCGQNFVDVAPYIADAEYRALPLIRGMGESAHDWGNLLTMTQSMHLAIPLARGSFTLGSIVMLAACGWAGYLLYRQWQRLQN